MRIKLFENIYGIKLIKDQDFEKPCSLIYASNGVMKSSFTKGIKNIIKGNKPSELIFNKVPKYNIEIMKKTHDSTREPNEQKNVICFNNDSYENIASIDNIPVLLVNEKLSNKFNNIKSEQIKNSNDLFKDFKKMFNIKDENKIYEYLSKIYNEKLDILPAEIIKLFKDRKIENHFLNKQKTGEILKLILDPKTDDLKKSTEINEYINFINEKKNGEYVDQNFTLTELEAIQKVLTKDATNFFLKKNSLKLNSNKGKAKIIENIEELNDIIKHENDMIYGSKEAKIKLQNLEKISKKNQTSEKLFKIISINTQNWIIEYLNDKNFLKNYFESLIFENINITKYIDENNKWIKEMESIRKEVYENFEKTKWCKVLKEFNNRMKLPFKIDIENKFNSTMNADNVPKIIFKYSDNSSRQKIVENEKEVLTFISSGEKKALFFLSLLYKINVLIEKNENKPGILLILDDIVESFDYQNKYAILNYLLEFINTDHYGQNNKLIILSHNFDFIRTCQYHFASKKTQTFLVTKNNDGVLSFKDFFDPKLPKITRDNAISVFTEWKETVLTSDDYSNNVKKLNSLVALLPVIRNINELNSSKSDFKLLNKILHFHKDVDINGIKKNSTDILWKDIENELSIFGIKNINNSVIKDKTIHSTVIQCCQEIIKENNNDKNIYITLQEKLILAYGIRIKLEKLMVDLLEKYNKESLDWSKNYTTSKFHFFLIKMDKNNKGKYNYNLRNTVDEALTLTNEVIHINSFMYEPLIDLDIDYLKRLYSKSNELSINSIPN